MAAEEKRRTKSGVSIHKVSNKSDQRMGGKSTLAERKREYHVESYLALDKPSQINLMQEKAKW